jgi:hypothetical protein
MPTADEIFVSSGNRKPDRNDYADCSGSRKATPLYSGCMAYFPDALAAVARLSKVGNDKHNPGQPLHWSKDKSADHADCLARHLVDHGAIDPETGLSHTVAVAWRALALLQTEIERAGQADPPPRSFTGVLPTAKPKRRARVYIAGPISKGKLADNIDRATAAFKALAQLGAAPWCPQWSVYSGGATGDGKVGDSGDDGPPGRYYAYIHATGCGLSWREWLDVDLAWVEVADAVLRLSGESAGADEEVALAKSKGIPVFYSVEECSYWLRTGYRIPVAG